MTAINESPMKLLLQLEAVVVRCEADLFILFFRTLLPSCRDQGRPIYLSIYIEHISEEGCWEEGKPERRQGAMVFIRE